VKHNNNILSEQFLNPIENRKNKVKHNNNILSEQFLNPIENRKKKMKKQ